MQREQIVEHLPGLRRYARALTGDAWAADDLLQDTLERACSKWRLWLAGSDLRAWLFTLMHHLFISQVRRKRLQPLGEDAPEASLHTLAAPIDPLDTSIDLQRCLLKLPEEQRVVLLLVTLEDLSYAQVARITGTPVGTVMSRLSRARERMRSLMDTQSLKSAPMLQRMK